MSLEQDSKQIFKNEQYVITEETREGSKFLSKRFSILNCPTDLLSEAYKEFELSSQYEELPLLKPVESKRESNFQEYIYEIQGKRISELAPLSVDDFLNFAINCSDSLHQFQNSDYSHRALSLDNIYWLKEQNRVLFSGHGRATKILKQDSNIEFYSSSDPRLPFLSPEQTGRTKTNLTQKTDQYSLGVIFFFLLTKQFPFDESSTDLIFAHLSKPPKKLNDFQPGFPLTLELLIEKLLSKAPEERFQSVLNLKNDLIKISSEADIWKIRNFKFDQQGRLSKPNLNPSFVGRKKELKTLRKLYQQSFAKKGCRLLVQGESGVGKSEFIRTIREQVYLDRGIFIEGKFDQNLSQEPYSSIKQAFASWWQQFLVFSNYSNEKIATKLRRKFEENNAILREILPSLENVLPDQKIEFSNENFVNRFQETVRRFMLFLLQEMPVTVLFIDDLQWMDASSLEIFQKVIWNIEAQQFLLIGAHRNDKQSLKTLSDCLKQIAETKFEQIELAKLDHQEIKKYLKKILNNTLIDEKLISFCQSSSGGNPFLLRQNILKVIESQDLEFDLEQSRWILNPLVAESQKQTTSPNLLELRLQSLPERVTKIFGIAALIGSNFEKEVLVLASKLEKKDVEDSLILALQKELIHLTSNKNEISDEIYQFSHDQIQEFFKGSLKEESTQKINLQIAEVLEKLSGDNSHLFLICNHLNFVPENLLDKEKRERVVQLYSAASKKSRLLASGNSSYEYAIKAKKILPNNAPTELTDIVTREFFLASLFSGKNPNFEEDLKNEISSLPKDQIEKKLIYFEIWIKKEIYSANFDKSLRLGKEALEILDLDISDKKIVKKRDKLEKKILKSLEKYHFQPELTEKSSDKKIDLLVSILIEIFVPAYNLQKVELAEFCIYQSVSFCLDNGYSNFSSFIFALLGYQLSMKFKNWELAEKCSAFSSKLGLYYPNSNLISKTAYTNLVFNESIYKPHQFILNQLIISFEKSVTAGEVFFGSGIGTFCLILNLRYKLDSFDDSLRRYYTFPKSNNLINFELVNLFLIEAGKFLKSQKKDLQDKLSDSFSLTTNRRRLKDLGYPQAIYLELVYSLSLYLHFERSDELLYLTGSPLVTALPGCFLQVEEIFLYSIARFLLIQSNKISEDIETIKDLNEKLEQLKNWSEIGPTNFLHLYYFLKANLEVLEKKYDFAVLSYEKSVETARTNEDFEREGMAAEYLAKHYIRQEDLEKAKVNLKIALVAYEKWGATAKINHFKDKYKTLLQDDSSKLASQFNSLEAISNFSKEISTLTNINFISEKLLQIILQISGATKVNLALSYLKQWNVYELSPTNKLVVKRDVSDLSTCDLPKEIVHYVASSRNEILIEDLNENDVFSFLDYFQSRNVKSLQALPMINLNHLVGVLYIEQENISMRNWNEISHVLHLIISQASASIHNGMLDLRKNLEEESNEMVDSQIENEALTKDSELVEDLAEIRKQRKQILFLQAENKFTILQTVTDKIHLNNSLKKLSPFLPEHFQRISRNNIVNFKNRPHLNLERGGKAELEIGDFKLPISRNHLKEVRRVISD